MKALKGFVMLFAVLGANATLGSEEKIVPEFINGVTRVSAEQLVDLVSKHSDLVIVDSRKVDDVRKGFIEGAISLPNTETNATSLAKNVKTKNTPIVFYCNGIHCHRSGEAAEVALAAGYKAVYWFRGGIEEWKEKGLPLTKP